jgi:hypothetical protein
VLLARLSTSMTVEGLITAGLLAAFVCVMMAIAVNVRETVATYRWKKIKPVPPDLGYLAQSGGMSDTDAVENEYLEKHSGGYDPNGNPY